VYNQRTETKLQKFVYNVSSPWKVSAAPEQYSVTCQQSLNSLSAGPKQCQQSLNSSPCFNENMVSPWAVKLKQPGFKNIDPIPNLNPALHDMSDHIDTPKAILIFDELLLSSPYMTSWLWLHYINLTYNNATRTSY